ncbi:hypothetical protein EGR_00168 [Echinococcus granulosus]|uniref:Uncharacterized protein n=1 Tax=Echinococcus granulosus TaxID=6210 RepID=W6VD71_ECHGR|nr:hypothetical protein EGR_00168 [Echinococcus granulosus]EUB64899.1 hypothetical protein EGR_00168 [Echinococcus granulosus]
MGISFIGLGVSLAVIVIIAVVIYLCCCRKRKSSSASDRVINPAGQGVRSDNLIANRDDPVCFISVSITIRISLLKNVLFVFYCSNYPALAFIFRLPASNNFSLPFKVLKSVMIVRPSHESMVDTDAFETRNYAQSKNQRRKCVDFFNGKRDLQSVFFTIKLLNISIHQFAA